MVALVLQLLLSSLFNCLTANSCVHVPASFVPQLGYHLRLHNANIYLSICLVLGTGFKYRFSQIKILYGSQTKRLLGLVNCTVLN